LPILHTGTDACFQRIIAMKKLSTIFTAAIFTMLSATAFACPKGMTMTGGTGPNHKGGTCVTTKEAKKHAATQHEKSKAHAAKEHSNMIKPAEKDMHKANTEMNKAKMDMNKANTEMSKPKP
jgi:flagellar hook-basal body complex protein FliE